MTARTLPAKKNQNGIRGIIRELLMNKHLYLMMLPTVIWFVIFCYFPLYGITLAFKKYDYALGMSCVSFYNEPELWPWIFVVLHIRQGCGFGTVTYIAAITGFDTSMYEAARVDGATRFQQIRHITLPGACSVA